MLNILTIFSFRKNLWFSRFSSKMRINANMRRRAGACLMLCQTKEGFRSPWLCRDRAHCICIHVVYCVKKYTNNLSRHYGCFGQILSESLFLLNLLIQNDMTVINSVAKACQTRSTSFLCPNKSKRPSTISSINLQVFCLILIQLIWCTYHF